MKKLFVIIIAAIGSVMFIEQISTKGDSVDLLFLHNVEALANGEDHSINCIPSKNSICVDGTHVELDSYYSPH